MESNTPKEDSIDVTPERFPVGKLGGMFASVPETIAPVDPGDMSKGVRHILSGEITGATPETVQDLSTE